MKKILVKLLFIVIMAGYLATWTLGVPMLHTAVSRQAITLQEFREPYKFRPSIRFEYSFPVLPFIIFSKHKFVSAAKGGEGGYYLCVWFVDKTKQWQLSGYNYK